MAKLLNDTSIATITSLDNSDYMNTVNPSTGEISKITVANVKDSITGGARIYAGTISQSGTSAPTISEAVNTTGATFTPARTSSGVYTITCSTTLFGVGTTLCFFTNSDDTPIGAVRTSTTVITITTSADDILTICSFKIEIY